MFDFGDLCNKKKVLMLLNFITFNRFKTLNEKKNKVTYFGNYDIQRPLRNLNFNPHCSKS